MAEPQIHNGYYYIQQPDGTWKRGERVQPQQGVALPADPVRQYEVPKAEADTRKAQAEADLIAAQTPYADLLARAQAERDLAEAEKARAEASRDPNAQVLDRGKIGQFLALENQLARLDQLYAEGPGSTTGVGAIADYLPSDVNAAFDSAGAGLSEVGLAAFRVPGVGSQSDAELRQFIAANTPRASDRDSAIREKLRNLRNRLEATKQAWGVDPKAPASDLLEGFGGGTQGSALDVLRTTGGAEGETQAVAPQDVGSGQTTIDPYPQAMIAAHDDLVRTLVSQGGGRIDPQAYANARAQLDREFGYQGDAQSYTGWANSVNEYLDAGGRTIPSGIVPAERLMTGAETMRNNLVNNPLAAAFVGAANTGSLGAVEAFAPGEYLALGDARPVSQAAGEIAGAIGATAALGGAGRAVAGSVAPRLLGGGGRGQLARNILTDAGYGGAFGGITQGDPLTGAALGAAGSFAGQGVASGIGAGIGGLQRTAAAQALRDRGVPVSVARQIGLGRVEDVMQSLPLAGDVARARQADSFQGFNEAAFQEAASPTTRLSNPFNPPAIGQGRQGIDELQQVEGRAYNAALDRVRVPIDTQFFRDLRPVTQAVRGLPDDYRSAAETIIERRVEPAVASREMTGREYQQALRGIRQARANAGSNPSLAGFDQEYRDALTGVEDLLTNTIERGAGRNTVDDLGIANEIYSNRRILENASLDRAKIGTRSGEVNVFTPSQLLEATRQAEKRYGTGRALREFAEQGQQVLPSSVPNSGTVDRMIALGAVPAAAGAIGGGVGFTNAQQDQGAQGTVSGTGLGLGTLAGASAILAALGTRRGQDVLERILITRPQAAQKFGQGIRNRGGIFGSAAVPIALQYQ